MIAGMQWIKPLDNANIYFNKLGSVQLVKGHVRMIKTISIGSMRERYNTTHSDINLLFNCSMTSEMDSINSCNYARDGLQSRLEMLEKEMDLVLQVVERREKRALDFLGTGLKMLFGVMDHDDEVAVNKAIQRLSSDTKKLATISADGFELISKINENMNTVTKNQEKVASTVRSLQREIMENKIDLNKQSNAIHLNRALVLSNNLIEALSVQVEKIHNAILFAKAGILDPFMINSGDLFNKLLNHREIGYIISQKDIDELLRKIKFSVVFDDATQTLIILLKIPSASRETFKLYECLVLPKIEDSIVVSLVGVPKYFAISEDGTLYLEEKDLDCFVTEEHKYICQDLVVRNIGNYPTCVTDVFVHKKDSLCEYKRYTSNFDAHNKVRGGLIVFSSLETTPVMRWHGSI